MPVRAAKFIARKNWIVCGSDDFQLRVYNYNTHEKVTQFEAHPDYIRCIAVHPTQPFVLTGSDDMTIKLWNWEKDWKCLQVFEGHTHYVMSLAINPKDPNTFASSCLDRMVKVWSFGSPVANFTLEAHDKGVNHVDYYHAGDKPYMVTTGDDKLVKVWDYQSKSCIQILEGHTSNVSFACFHPDLPIIISGSEDGTFKIWHANTYRLEQTLNYGLERAWCIAYLRGSNSIGMGFDEGCVVIKMGSEEPAISMDNSGKILWAKHNEIESAAIKPEQEEAMTDGVKLSLSTKELGNCDVYPQSLQHSPNGRFVVACGDGEYIIYTALRLNNKAFGSALEFVWASNSNEYAVRESNVSIRIYKAFKERPNVLKAGYSFDHIYGGFLLGIKSADFIGFHDWESGNLVRRIDIVARNVYWSDNGELLAIACQDTYYVLKYNQDAYIAAVGAGTVNQDEGIEGTFDVVADIGETIKSGRWIGDCFIYTNSANKLNYMIGGQVYTITHFDSGMYLLGYIPRDGRIFLSDKEFNVVSYALSLSLVEYQTCVLHGDMDAAANLLETIPTDQKGKVARFLESQGQLDLALQVSSDKEHQFELALQLNRLDIAVELARETNLEPKWKVVGDKALAVWDVILAEECYRNANDLGGLLLIYSSSGNAQGMKELAEKAGIIVQQC